MIISMAVMTARERGIPLCFTGYTPGQYPNVSFENFLKSGSSIYFSHAVHRDDPPDFLRIVREPLEDRFGSCVRPYFLRSQYLRENETAPRFLFPFHSALDYSEAEIYATIAKLGWTPPQDTDPCSTNCLLNSVGNYATLKQFGFHPYAGEISFMVRRGDMMKENVSLLETVDPASPGFVASLHRLGMTTADIYGEFPL
jgi:hypothetical protein